MLQNYGGVVPDFLKMWAIGSGKSPPENENYPKKRTRHDHDGMRNLGRSGGHRPEQKWY